MNKIRIIKEKNLISVNDMIDYLGVIYNLTNEKKNILKWNFTQLILKQIYNDYKRNIKVNHYYLITGDDSFFNWSYFFSISKVFKRNGFSNAIDFIDPLMYELNKDKFKEVKIDLC